MRQWVTDQQVTLKRISGNVFLVEMHPLPHVVETLRARVVTLITHCADEPICGWNLLKYLGQCGRETSASGRLPNQIGVQIPPAEWVWHRFGDK